MEPTAEPRIEAGIAMTHQMARLWEAAAKTQGELQQQLSASQEKCRNLENELDTETRARKEQERLVEQLYARLEQKEREEARLLLQFQQKQLELEASHEKCRILETQLDGEIRARQASQDKCRKLENDLDAKTREHEIKVEQLNTRLSQKERDYTMLEFQKAREALEAQKRLKDSEENWCRQLTEYKEKLLSVIHEQRCPSSQAAEYRCAQPIPVSRLEDARQTDASFAGMLGEQDALHSRLKSNLAAMAVASRPAYSPGYRSLLARSRSSPNRPSSATAHRLFDP